jgi:WXG100 family type VII secretion target
MQCAKPNGKPPDLAVGKACTIFVRDEVYKKSNKEESKMAGLIKVTPEIMRSTADRLQRDSGQWTMLVSKIYAAVDEMNSMWDGLGNNAFHEAFQSFRPSFDKLAVVMTDYNTAIRTAADKYDTGEQTIANIAGKR